MPHMYRKFMKNHVEFKAKRLIFYMGFVLVAILKLLVIIFLRNFSLSHFINIKKIKI